MKLHYKNWNRPSPANFKKFKKVLSVTLNTLISVLLLFGYKEDSLILLFIKLGESYFMSLLDTFLGEEIIS